MIDWTKPIESVWKDGENLIARHIGTYDHEYSHIVAYKTPATGNEELFRVNDSGDVAGFNSVKIRNVPDEPETLWVPEWTNGSFGEPLLRKKSYLKPLRWHPFTPIKETDQCT